MLIRQLILGAAIVLLLFVQTTSGQTTIMAAVVLSEEAMNGLDAWLRDQMQNTQRMIRIDKAKDLLGKARSAYITAIQQVDTEIRRLEQNPDLNRNELARLRSVKQDATQAHRRLSFLSKLTESRQEEKNILLGALKSPYFRKTIQEITALNNRLKGTLDTNARTLAGNGSEVIGSIEVRSIDIYRGELELYVMEDLPGGGRIETPLVRDQGVAVRQLPIVVRASIRDENKKRLLAAPENAITIEFEGSDDGLPDQVIRYQGTAGQSVWRTSETYKWEPDNKDPRMREKLRAFMTRNSSRYAKGDIAEIHPLGGTVQNLVFYIDAQCDGWHRESTINGRKVEGDIVPKNNTASARLVVSIFPR
jgi:hypothetical protein